MWNYSTGTVPEGINGGGLNSVYADQERGIFLMSYTAREYAYGEQPIVAALQVARARLERTTGSSEERVRESLTLANNEIVSTLQTPGVESWPGTMLIAILLTPMAATLGQVGNLSLYKVKADRIRKVAPDSPLADIRFSKGQPDESGESAPADSFGKTRVIGLRAHEPEDNDFVQVSKLSIGSDNALLVCSNNLTSGLPEAQILKIIREHPGNRARVVRALLNAGGVLGNNDRASVLFIEGPKFSCALRVSKRLSPSQPPSI
jgi:serine/threonine protein phosphatase PrpC